MTAPPVHEKRIRSSKRATRLAGRESKSGTNRCSVLAIESSEVASLAVASH